MRLDKFLKVSRLIKRRTVANKMCDAGKVFVNGKISKAAADVKLNDILEIKGVNSSVKVKVIKISEITNKQNASDLYETV